MPQFPAKLEEQSLEGMMILLAEDELRLRTIVKMMLEELGAVVIEVADGSSAIEEYRSRSHDIDLVLLDVRMNGLSGGSTFKRLLEIDEEVKVVLSSGVLPEEDLIQILEENNGGFIEKPFNLAQLSNVIVTVLAGRSVIWTS
jgi:DNA-binding response OmpR family regulator